MFVANSINFMIMPVHKSSHEIRKGMQNDDILPSPQSYTSKSRSTSVRDSPTVKTLQTDRPVMDEGITSSKKGLGQDEEPSLTLARRCIIGSLVILQIVNIPLHLKQNIKKWLL